MKVVKSGVGAEEGVPDARDILLSGCSPEERIKNTCVFISVGNIRFPCVDACEGVGWRANAEHPWARDTKHAAAPDIVLGAGIDVARDIQLHRRVARPDADVTAVGIK